MTRDPLLPVHLVDGVWTTEGAGSAAVPATDTPPSTGARNLPCDPYPPPFVKTVSLVAGQSTDATEREPGIMTPMTWPAPAEPDLTIPWMPWGYDKTESRQWAKPGAEDGTVEIGGQTFRATVNANDWCKFTAPRVAPSFGYTPTTGETSVSFDAEAIRPGEVTK